MNWNFSAVLTYNDEQFHLLEKIKMTETFKSLESLLNVDCLPTITTTADCLADWYKYVHLCITIPMIRGFK